MKKFILITLLILVVIYSVVITGVIIKNIKFKNKEIENVMTADPTANKSIIIQHIMAVTKEGKYISRPITDDSTVSIILADTTYTDVAIFTGEEGKEVKTTVLRGFKNKINSSLKVYWLIAVSPDGSIQFSTTVDPIVDTFLESPDIIHLIGCYITNSGKIGIRDVKQWKDFQLRELVIDNTAKDYWLITILSDGSVQYSSKTNDINSLLKNPKVEHLIVCYITNGKIGIKDLKEKDRPKREIIIQ